MVRTTQSEHFITLDIYLDKPRDPVAESLGFPEVIQCRRLHLDRMAILQL